VRVWHPGQDWIFEAGGFGVFDPGINALSILTHILPAHFALHAAKLVVPSNCQAPIAAELDFKFVGSAATMHVVLDFMQTGPQTWDIVVETDAGTLLLQRGGAIVSVNGAPLTAADSYNGPGALPGEYPSLYRRFAQLIETRTSDVDIRPLIHVADACMLGARESGPPFNF